MDFGAITRAKEDNSYKMTHEWLLSLVGEGSEQIVDPLGFNEEYLNTPAELRWAVDLLKAETLVDFEDEPEVIETREENNLPPKIVRIQVPTGKSYEDSVDDFKSWNSLKQDIKRQPNKLEHNCNLFIQATDGVEQLARPRKYQDAVFILNQKTSAGIVYIAEGQEKLQSNPIRGKGLNPGDSITYETEAGLWMIVQAGLSATIDVISSYYDLDDES